MLGLPLIRNEKTVDPADPSSPAVIQIECAMGAAIEVFEGATAIGVGRTDSCRSRRPTTCWCSALDVYEVGADSRLSKITDPAPLVDLDSRYYKAIAAFDRRFTSGAPSLRRASRLSVEGDWTFGADVSIVGTVELADQGTPQTVPAGSVLGAEG